MRSAIICVDDDNWMLSVLGDLLNKWLGENYTVEKALSGSEALEILNDCINDNIEVSLFISDYLMPGMKGDEVLERVKAISPITRRIMLTGFAALEGVVNAINKAGIYRFMSKPWDNKDMMMTVLQAIRSYEQDKRTEKLAQSHKELYQKFQEQNIVLQSSLKRVIGTLSAATEIREKGMTGHSRRVADYSLQIAGRINMSDNETKVLEVSALLHDVGKLGLSDEDVNAMLGVDSYLENDIARRQSEQAKALLSQMEPEILPGILYHMERFDGLGPYGLNLPDIPINARIIGLCHHFDLVCVAHPDMTPAEAINEISPLKCKVFDLRLFNILSRVLGI